MESSSLGASKSNELLNVIESSLNISKRHHFFLWAQGELQALLPHESLVCCLHGKNGVCASVQQFSWKPYFAESELGQSVQSGSGRFARLLELWSAAAKPVLIDLAELEGRFSDDALFAEPLETFSWAAAHGVRGHDGTAISSFIFFGATESLDKPHSLILELVVPHMHSALVRALAADEDPVAMVPASAISAREREVLKLISDGKTNPEIAQILYLSPFTVKSHIKNIFKKLNTTSRSQAVALALARGLISSAR